MWRPRFPPNRSDAWTAVLLVVGLPCLFLLTQGAPVIETLFTGAVIGGVLLLVHS